MRYRISPELEQQARDVITETYSRIIDESEASPAEAFSLLSTVLLDIRDTQSAGSFDEKAPEVRISVLRRRAQDTAEELYSSPDGEDQPLPCFIEMLSALPCLTLENACLAFEAQSRPNVTKPFSMLKTREEWAALGGSLMTAAVPVYLIFPDGNDTFKVYDAMYVMGNRKEPTPRDLSFEELIDRDFTCFLTRFGLTFRRNDNIITRAKYDPENDCILYKRGRDNTEAYRYVIRSIADAVINRMIGEGDRYGLSGYYDLAADTVTYIAAARRGVIFNDIRRNRTECFHACFQAEDRESFMKYLLIIMTAADEITCRLEDTADERA